MAFEIEPTQFAAYEFDNQTQIDEAVNKINKYTQIVEYNIKQVGSKKKILNDDPAYPKQNDYYAFWFSNPEVTKISTGDQKKGVTKFHKQKEKLSLNKKKKAEIEIKVNQTEIQGSQSANNDQDFISVSYFLARNDTALAEQFLEYCENDS